MGGLFVAEPLPSSSTDVQLVHVSRAGRELWRTGPLTSALYTWEGPTAVVGDQLITRGVGRWEVRDGGQLGGPLTQGRLYSDNEFVAEQSLVSDGTLAWVPRANGSGVAGVSVSSGVELWSLAHDGGITMSQPLLTAAASVVYAVGTATGVDLREVDEQGVERWSCPTTFPFSFLGGAALTDGRLVLAVEPVANPNRRAPKQVVGFELPGVRPATSGWTTVGGNPGQTGRPR